MHEDPAFRPLRWIGAIAAFGVVAAALAVLAWEAVVDSFVYVGDGRSQSDVIILGSEEPDEAAGPDADADAAADDQAGTAADDEAETAADDVPVAALYEIQPGDTGSSIARDLFGRQDAWEAIAEYNDLDPSATLTVGDTLRIPEL